MTAWHCRSAAAAFAAFASLGALADGALLAVDGKTDYTIAVSPDAGACDRFAARELAQFLKESTGAEFPVATGAAAGSRTI